MKLTLINGRELSAEEAQLWSNIQQRHFAFASPYFSPQFTSAVAEARNDVYIGLLQIDGKIVGFFPFQSKNMRLGRPVGGRLSDYQGVVVPDDVEWTAQELIQGCNLEHWEFNHLIASQEPFKPYHQQLHTSPAVNISRGYEAYASQCRSRRFKALKRIGVLKRKLEHEYGPLRYEAHVSDTRELRRLIECKSAQYRKRGSIDVFEWRWAVELIERIHSTQTKNFAGMLSTIYAGDELVASHMGMRSRRVWHYWFPCYNIKFASYSPGLILLLEIIRSAEQLGIRLIDLGRGSHAYKNRFANFSTPIAQGLVTVPSTALV